MKINPSGGREIYQAYLQSAKNNDNAQKAGAPQARPINTDKVTLSGDAAAMAEIGRARAAMAAEVESAGDPARLEALRGQVQAGTYFVSTDALAGAIMGEEA